MKPTREPVQIEMQIKIQRQIERQQAEQNGSDANPLAIADSPAATWSYFGENRAFSAHGGSHNHLPPAIEFGLQPDHGPRAWMSAGLEPWLGGLMIFLVGLVSAALSPL